MHYYGDDPKDNVHQLVMIPMMHGDNTNVASRLHSIDQTEVKTEENILLEEYSPLNFRRLDND